MPNKLIAADEMAKRVQSSLEKAADKYQSESQCSDKEKESFMYAALLYTFGGMFES